MNINDNFDWEDVENKIGIICYRFENLKPWHEDLAQELRIHAYYVSRNYYDLYRKGQIGAHDIVFNAFRDMRPEKRPAFVKMTNEVERQCQLNSSTWKSTMKKIDSIILKKQTTNCKDQ